MPGFCSRACCCSGHCTRLRRRPTRGKWSSRARDSRVQQQLRARHWERGPEAEWPKPAARIHSPMPIRPTRIRTRMRRQHRPLEKAQWFTMSRQAARIRKWIHTVRRFPHRGRIRMSIPRWRPPFPRPRRMDRKSKHPYQAATGPAIPPPAPSTDVPMPEIPGPPGVPRPVHTPDYGPEGVGAGAPHAEAPAPQQPGAPVHPDVDPHGPTVPAPADPTGPTSRPPGTPDLENPVFPPDPRVPRPVHTPDYGPEPDVHPQQPAVPVHPDADPHGPTVPAPAPVDVDPTGPTSRPPGTPDLENPVFPPNPAVPRPVHTPDYGPEPDFRPQQPVPVHPDADPHGPTVPAPAPVHPEVDPHAPTVPAADPLAPTVPAADPLAPTVPAADPLAPTVPAADPTPAAAQAPTPPQPATTDDYLTFVHNQAGFEAGAELPRR